MKFRMKSPNVGLREGDGSTSVDQREPVSWISSLGVMKEGMGLSFGHLEKVT